MSVTVSPRVPKDLDYSEDSGVFISDARMMPDISFLTLEPTHYTHADYAYFQDDGRAFASTPDPGARRKSNRRRDVRTVVREQTESSTTGNEDNGRPYTPDSGTKSKRKKQRDSDLAFAGLPEFKYKTIADGDSFRLVTLRSGAFSDVISYAWESTVREKAILLDDHVFGVTSNLYSAMQHLRDKRVDILIWIDQICIDQENKLERGHQVSIMKRIFNQAREVFVWLGEADQHCGRLYEYAKNMRRGESNTPSRDLNERSLKRAILKLLKRPWFQRVWVIPEVALSKHTTIVCGNHQFSWDNLVKLIRDVQLRTETGFDKQVCLLGNPRQRISIITEMIAGQKEALAHTDITQLLILAKSSKATDVLDTVYAFYALTHVTTVPTYVGLPPDVLFVEISHIYINTIKYESSYSSWHNLTWAQRNFQLMGILYSAGALHQHSYYCLPSWVPDWTHSWHLAPIWCKPTPSFSAGSSYDDWSAKVRSDFRAGGDRRETFKIVQGTKGELLVAVLILDTILQVDAVTPTATPGTSQVLSGSPMEQWDASDIPTLRFGRHFFATTKGHVGLSTPGIDVGDEVAIIVGGDVPVVLRPCSSDDEPRRIYRLLCDCYVQTPYVMNGDYMREKWTLAEDIVLI